MPCETIRSHAQIQALQARSSSDEHMLVILVSLESVRTARESYALLRKLVDSRSWVCVEMDLLSIVAGLSLELHRLEHDLLPQLMVPDQPKLERGLLEALLVVKNSAMTLSNLGKAFKEALGDRGLLDEDLISGRAKNLSRLLKETVVHVLEASCNMSLIPEERVQWLVQLVTALLATPVRFSHDFDE